MLVFPLPNTSTWNTIKTPKWETCNKNKSSSAAKGTKGQETEVALYLINLQLPNACPSLSRRCSTMQFFPTSRINKTPGLFFCFLLLSTQIMQKTKRKTEQPKSRPWNLLRQSMIDFYFTLPLFICFFLNHTVLWSLPITPHEPCKAAGTSQRALKTQMAPNEGVFSQTAGQLYDYSSISALPKANQGPTS